MHVNTYNQPIYTEKELLEVLYSCKKLLDKQITTENKSVVNRYNESIRSCGDKIKSICMADDNFSSIEEFDTSMQQQWFIPENYLTLDIESWLVNQCTTAHSKDRVLLELKLFTAHNMIPVLKCAKYLVDTMRQYNLLWGVGRGSSVASYCLFLIGIHKVDSLMYNLNINEFLKEV